MAGAKSSKKLAGSPLLGKYELGKLLGRGTFAKVYHARSLDGGDDPVAIKVLDKSQLTSTGMITRVLHEVSAMRRLRHPNVLRLHEVLATRTKIYLVMELAPGGDLLTRLASLPSRRLPEHAARRVFLQLANALSYCHARGVSHRDVKPQNVLIDSQGQLKVSDFGLAALLPDSLRDDGRLHTACGTPAFTAPEVLRRKAYDGAKADAWSCGVILFALLAGSLPFDDANIPGMCRRAQRREYAVPAWVSRPARRLIARLLDPNPDTRLAVGDLPDHPWFKRSLSVDSQLGGLIAGQPERDLAFAAAPHALNAFDIISMSPGLDLSGMFGESRRVREKRFMTTATLEETVERLGRAGDRLGYFLVGKKGVERLPIGGVQGIVAMSMEVSEVSRELMLVELRLESGDGDEAQAFGWDDLRVELGDVVMAWHVCEDG
ncbi:hypothetical protein PR202_gb11706 [Eleusine coracana subsp. coracana]|uniref:non-specific serine/threonine protein kinase n=1 Tax=Eleusine coracana subsp. coracana TaxID=191504 RepID=A0AAV5EME0_ELECO|nr:hypothetical protein QOZ80_3BG0270260 [Eleusine coracana subsp. coracana]GJN24002.1 hypothetical protein PR202_gb11706 [Eleusine coracana subsp. coracana]